MNIAAVIEYINKKHDIKLDSSYYTNISLWRAWWQGYHKPFHTFKEIGLDGTTIERKLYTLKMAKKVCEDWASGLLNEELVITIDDDASKEYVLGSGNDGDDVDADEEGNSSRSLSMGMLAKNRFLNQANRLIEKTFALGTGAFVLRINNMTVGNNDQIMQNKDIGLKIEYLSADHIIPLSARDGKITEVAFVSDVLMRGAKLVYLETHRLVDGSYIITNEYLRQDEEVFVEQELPEGILSEFRTGGEVPLFVILSPNIENNIDPGNPMGISIYANAIDNLEGADLAYNNLNKDFKLGGKKVFLNNKLTKRDKTGKIITPDDVAQQLFVETGDDLIDSEGKTMIYEHNPSLRVDENVEGVQAQLDLLSFKCGLGTKFYQFSKGTVGRAVTATEYLGDRQDLTRSTSKHAMAIREAIEELIRSILWVRRQLAGDKVDPETRIEIDLGDSFISDSASERAQDLQDVRDGIMNKWEYRAKWYGESDDVAKANVPASNYEEDPFGFNQNQSGSL